MKSAVPPIETYTISEVNADIGNKSSSKHFHIFTIDELEYTAKMFRPRRSDHYKISLVTAGQMKVKHNLIDYQLNKNDLFFIPPGVVHQIVEQNDFLATTIGFNMEFLNEVGFPQKNIESFNFFSSQNSPLLSLTEAEAASIRTLLLLLSEKDRSQPAHLFKQEIIHYGFGLFLFELAALFKKYRASKSIKLTRKESLLLSFTKLLSLHFIKERSVQYYADLLFVTPRHLTKTIKEITNKTVSELIDEMVITEAKILLTDLSMPVARVADHLHFSDQFSFSKFFKKRTGINPSEYKRSL